MDITRENYREYDAINYSTLSTLDKGQPSKILEGKDWSDGLQNGDILDTLAFDGEDALNEEYYVSTMSDGDMPSDNIKAIIDESGDLSEESFLSVAKRINYGQSWKEATILKKVNEDGGKYINHLKESKGRKIISFDQYTSLKRASEMLKSDSKTAMFFEGSEFQKPMVANLRIGDGEYAFKCLADIFIEINNEIAVLDLKYSSYPLAQFEYQFLKWRYDIQAALYSAIPGKLFNKPVSFYNIVYSSADNAVFRFKVHSNTLLAGTIGGKTPNGRKYKGYKELAKEYLWHKNHNVWNLPYEFCVNSEIEINPYE